jgi:hypothetical protein
MGKMGEGELSTQDGTVQQSILIQAQKFIVFFRESTPRGGGVDLPNIAGMLQHLQQLLHDLSSQFDRDWLHKLPPALIAPCFDEINLCA